MRELTLNKLPKKVLAELDMETVFKASRCVLAAERLLVFRKLHEKELSVADICRRTRIKRRHCEPFADHYALVVVFLTQNLTKLQYGICLNTSRACSRFSYDTYKYSVI